MFTEEQRASGTSEIQIKALVEDGYKKGRFKAPGRPGLVYMLSDHNYVFDPKRKAVIHFPGHLMCYAPYATQKDVGSGPGGPYMRLVDGRYAEAENLGAVVNGDRNDFEPFIAPDESFLIFMSGRLGGQGLGDLWVTYNRAERGQRLWPSARTSIHPPASIRRAFLPTGARFSGPARGKRSTPMVAGFRTAS
jgi:hypothetical protein